LQKKRYFVKESEVTPYSPANHAETVNRRLIGPETVGAKHLEVLLGTVGAIGSGALAHMHPGIEQVCYMLQGRAKVEVDGQKFEMGPGDTCFFPADMPHVFTRVSEETLRVLVIYSPPYVESKEKGVAV
jgi:mannose-6-phosphate isomerase-like protein (cupin superfamily)